MKRFFSLVIAVAVVLSTSVVSTLATENDFDGDGLTDKAETMHKTDPKVTDTDADGLTDGEEVNLYHTDPIVKDTDKDSLLDGEEVMTYKTSPTKHDTDGDGLSDSSEVKAYSTNPLAADTDADGLTDQEEITKTKTDPLDADTDNDGLKDGTEYMAGYDPLENSSPYVGGVKCDSPEIESIYYGSEKVYPFGQGPLSIDYSSTTPITFEYKECPYDAVTYTLEFDGDQFKNDKGEVLVKDVATTNIMLNPTQVLDIFFGEFDGTEGKGSFRVKNSTGDISNTITLSINFEGYVPGVDYTVEPKAAKKVVTKKEETAPKKVSVKKKKVNPVGPKQYKEKPKLNASGNVEATFTELPEESMAPSFLDLGDHWAGKAIDQLRRFGLVSGKEDRKYAPNSYITRAELVTMAMKSFNHNIDKYEGVQVFSDVPTDKYYSTSIAAAYDLGIVTGYENETFEPFAYVNRAEAVKILLLASGVKVNGDEVTTKFTDVAMDSWYMPFVAKSVQNNIVKGYYNTNLFGPQNNMTRGEAASVVHQIIFEFYMYI